MKQLLSHSIDGKTLLKNALARIDQWIIGLAIVIRLYEYWMDRSVWMDEASLQRNIAGVPIWPIWRPLANAQLAPAGFLTVERLISQLFGSSPRALRFIPLISGIVAIPLFHRLARAALEPRAATFALALFALGYDPIYYTIELKQYSSDLAISLACLLAAWLVTERATPGRLLALGSMSMLAPWLSHPSIFTIAGSGLGLVVFLARDHRWRELRWVIAIGAMGGLSFAGSYLVSVRLLENHDAMWRFWSICFLRFPPTNPQDARFLGGQFVEVLANPLDLISPLCPVLSTIFITAACLASCRVLIVGQSRLLILSSLPIMMTAVASSARRYPFHGRLILFLVPMFDLLIVAGIASIGDRWRRRGKTLSLTLLVLLLIHPLLDSAYLLSTRYSREFNPIGDLHRPPFPVEKPIERIRPATIGPLETIKPG